MGVDYPRRCRRQLGALVASNHWQSNAHPPIRHEQENIEWPTRRVSRPHPRSDDVEPNASPYPWGLGRPPPAPPDAADGAVAEAIYRGHMLTD